MLRVRPLRPPHRVLLAGLAVGVVVGLAVGGARAGVALGVLRVPPAVRAAVAGLPPAPTSSDARGWRLDPALSDEFDGTGPVDHRRWDTLRATEGFAAGGAPFNPPIERAFYRPDGVTRADGVAVFTIRDEPPTTVAGHTYRLSSGMIRSGRLRPVVRAPGETLYLEARVLLPAGGHGLWPAMWLVDAAHDDPVWRAEHQAPEVDVFELWADGVSEDWRRPWFNTHRWADGHVVHGTEQPFGEDALGGWHTLGVQLDDERAVPYFDGVAYPQAGQDETVPAGRPMDLVLNVAVAACSGHARSCDRPRTDDVTGTAMTVDHVRLYRRGG